MLGHRRTGSGRHSVFRGIRYTGLTSRERTCIASRAQLAAYLRLHSIHRPADFDSDSDLRAAHSLRGVRTNGSSSGASF